MTDSGQSSGRPSTQAAGSPLDEALGSGEAPSGGTPRPYTLAGLDIYTMRARWAPALLACLPLLALALVALPYLTGADKMWSLVSLAVTTFAALTARKAGNRVQPELYAEWGGAPTTMRMRFASGTSAQEIRRRHKLVERILGDGLLMPTQSEEADDPLGADVEYEAVMRRIVARVRNLRGHGLAIAENRNYGFARNLLGLKRLGQASAVLSALLSVGAAAVLVLAQGVAEGLVNALPLALPFLVAGVALMLWPQVDADFVKPSADAYADRVVDALDQLATHP